MDEKDLKIQALLEEVTRLAGINADLRVQVTILSNRLTPQDTPPNLEALEGEVLD